MLTGTPIGDRCEGADDYAELLATVERKLIALDQFLTSLDGMPKDKESDQASAPITLNPVKS